MGFLESWGEASLTSLGFFWTALWAFILGYIVSSIIQVFVTRQRMQDAMGKEGPKSVALGTFFGFISSSCSFAALSGTRAIMAKGAGLAPSLAFLLASTNLVIELGIVIAVFLAWQFVVAEYIGGILLILVVWGLVRVTRPKKLVDEVRQRLEGDDEDEDERPALEKVKDPEAWDATARTYAGEWGMVWKDVTIGFTVAGIIAAFVPRSFFEALFIGAGSDPSFGQVVAQTVVGPVAAFFTFIGSMGNIPLAAVLFQNGVSMAGVMAFIFSDLVVFPVLRIQAQYYGWKMAGYILALFLAALVVVSVALHYAFDFAGFLPESAAGSQVAPEQRFALDYTFWLNITFLAGSAYLVWRWFKTREPKGPMKDPLERGLKVVAFTAYAWLAGGLGVWLWQAYG